MSRVSANFVVFVLAAVGAFIALVTGIAHAGGAELPCGGIQSGCDVIALPENSRWLGVPIAFYGLALYMFVALLAMFRAAIGLENSVRLGTSMWIMLAAGSLISIGLMAHGYMNLKATCLWCLASAITMVIAFLVHSYGMTNARRAGKAAPFAAFMGVLSLAVVAGAVYGFSLRPDAPQAQVIENKQPVYEASDPFLGDENAPIVITEFTDLYCPTCRSQHAWLMETLGPLIESGRIKLVVRHYPLPNLHPLAIEAALFAVYAQSEGKFWEFFEVAHTLQDKEDKEALLNAVTQAGLDRRYAETLLADKALRDPLVKQMQKDIDDGTKLGVEATPSWFVDYPDGQRQFAVGSGIQRLVGDSMFQEAIK
jgi:protein-disulfide isomerase